MINKLIQIVAALCSVTYVGAKNECTLMQPICGSDGFTFTVEGGGSIITSEEANDYTCLGNKPSPTWYYLIIDNPGSITFSLFAESDIDFHVSSGQIKSFFDRFLFM